MIAAAFELVEAETHSPFRCVHSRCDTFANEHPLHFHPEFELTLILASAGTRYVGDSVARYGPGDLVLSGPNLPHCWREDADTSGSNAPEWIIAQFDPAHFGADLLGTPEAAPLKRLLDAATAGLSFDQSVAAEVEPLLLQSVGAKGLARHIKLLETLDKLAHQHSQPLSTLSPAQGSTIDTKLVERLDTVHRYIVDNLAGEISQAVIAAQLGMRPSAFSKFFRASTGRTFMGLVKLLRINEACRLLASSDARITEIALDCGYGHTSHFDQHFLELKGMSPRAYRRGLRDLARPQRRLEKER